MTESRQIVYPSAPPSVAHQAPPEAWPLAPPADVRVRRQFVTHARFCSVVAFAGAVLAAVGSLLAWADYADGKHLKGIDHGNGWISLTGALLVAGLAGAVWFGVRHIVLRFALSLASGGLLAVFFFNRFRVHQADGRSKIGPINIGVGLQLVGIGAFLTLLAAILVVVPAVRRSRS